MAFLTIISNLRNEKRRLATRMLLKLLSSSLFYREHAQTCQEHCIAESQQTEINIFENKHGKNTSYNQ